MLPPGNVGEGIQEHKAAPWLERSWGKEGFVCVHGAAGIGGVASGT